VKGLEKDNRTQTPLEYYTTYLKTINFCKKCNYENKMAGNGQLTSERASSGSHATNRTLTS
jgi:hypothetical protein